MGLIQLVEGQRLRFLKRRKSVSNFYLNFQPTSLPYKFQTYQLQQLHEPITENSNNQWINQSLSSSLPIPKCVLLTLQNPNTVHKICHNHLTSTWKKKKKTAQLPEESVRIHHKMIVLATRLHRFQSNLNCSNPKRKLVHKN